MPPGPVPLIVESGVNDPETSDAALEAAIDENETEAPGPPEGAVVDGTALVTVKDIDALSKTEDPLTEGAVDPTILPSSVLERVIISEET